MFTVIRDLLRHNRKFAIGVVFLGLIVVFSVLSFFSPVDPTLQYIEFPDLAPSAEYWFGTNSRGQDLFWQLTFAFRNTLLFGIIVSGLSRVISITVGLLSGYMGGMVDRVLMVVNDVFVTLPLFPLLLVFFFVFGTSLTTVYLALLMATLGWAFDARLIRSIALGLRHREFTRHAVFFGMSPLKIMFEEHLPYVMPVVFTTAIANMLWAIGIEVTLAILGFTNIDIPTVGTTIYWANNHSALLVGNWWWVVIPVVLVVIMFIGLYTPHGIAQRVHRPAVPPPQDGGLMPSAPDRTGVAEQVDVLTLTNLKAYYLTNYYGVEREVRAVDDISIAVRADEVYGIAGEGPSGKTTLIKTFAGAVHPPLRIVGGSITYRFGDREIDPYAISAQELNRIRWKHVSYIMQGSMSVLNPVRRIGQEASPTSPSGTWACRSPTSGRRSRRTSSGSTWRPRCCAPTPTSSPAACGSA